MSNPKLNNQIQQAVNSWADTIKDTTRSPRSITSLLRNHFKAQGVYPKVTLEYISMGGHAWYSVGGEYAYSEIYDFTLRIFFDPASKHKPIKCTAEWIEDLRIELIEVGIHEMQHKHQDRSRKFDIMMLPNRLHDLRTIDTKYLSNSEEIDAYGVSIAYGLYERHGKEAINDFHKLVQTVYDMDHYVRTFRHDFNHPVMRTVLKKVYRNFLEII